MFYFKEQWENVSKHITADADAGRTARCFQAAKQPGHNSNGTEAKENIRADCRSRGKQSIGLLISGCLTPGGTERLI